MKIRSIVFIGVAAVAILTMVGTAPVKRPAASASWADLMPDDSGARYACLLDRTHPRLHFMDLLWGGPLGAEAAAEVAANLPSAPNRNAPRVYTEGSKTVREYNLDIVQKVFDYGGGNTWTAWTYNGTVPGPTLHVKPGEILRVHVTNHLDRVHSFHSHMEYYPIEDDGSQVNIINNKGTGAMIPPGASYTYEFPWSLTTTVTQRIRSLRSISTSSKAFMG